VSDKCLVTGGGHQLKIPYVDRRDNIECDSSWYEGEQK
jgi:hypothetical protein